MANKDKGATALVTRLSGRLRTSRIVTNTVQVSVQETLSTLIYTHYKMVFLVSSTMFYTFASDNGGFFAHKIRLYNRQRYAEPFLLGGGG